MFLPKPPILIDKLKPATMSLARGFMFVIFEQLPEIGSDKVVRKIAAYPKDFANHRDLSPLDPFSNITEAEHALGNNSSRFLSASSKPFGSPTNVLKGMPKTYSTESPSSANPKDFTGRYGNKDIRPVIIDLNKLPPGTRIIDQNELLGFLEQHAADLTKEEKFRITRLMETIKNIEGEVLIEGGVHKDAVKKVSNVHSAYILTAEELVAKHRLGQITEAELNAQLKVLAKSYNRVKMFGKFGRVITVVGIVLTAVDVAQAAQKSYQKRSYRPIAAETVRQIGGWGGAWAGAQSGAVIGAIFGVELTPVGMVVTGAIGAVAFGAIGYFLGDIAAGWIDPPEEMKQELRKDVNFAEGLKDRDIRLTVEAGEDQYNFRRRALIAAAIEVQRETYRMVDRQLPTRFANKLAPLRASNITGDYQLNWIKNADGTNPAADTNKDGIIESQEWKKQESQLFTYRLGGDEVDELIRMIFGLSRQHLKPERRF